MASESADGPNNRACPVCGATGTQNRGRILHPEPPRVAGVPIDLGATPFTLQRCRECGFQFKHPEIEPARLLACYAAGAADVWGVEPDPWQRQFDVVETILRRRTAGRRLLDVGCFNGALLQFLGPSWERCGIEPSHAAAALARARGIDVLAPTWESLDPDLPPFDAILALDIIEHVSHPLEFIRAASARLRPNGILVVLTGNTDALAWRLQGSRYWYNSLPEHVSFFNHQSLTALARRTTLDIIEFHTLAHKRLNRAHWAADMAKSTVFLAARAVGGFGIPAIRRRITDRRGPTIQTARDHLLAVFGKR